MKEIEDSNKKILEEIKESKQSLQKEKDRLKKKRDKLAQKIPFQVRLCSIDDEGKWNLDKLGLTILEDIKSKIRILTLVEVDSNDNFALSNMFFPPNTHKISSKSDNPEIWMFKPRKFSLNSEEKLIILDVRGFNTNKLEQSIQSKIFSFLIFISSLIVLRTSTSQNNLTIDLIKNFSSIQHPHAFQFTSFQHPILSSRISPNLLWVFNKETPQSSPDFFLKEFMAQNKDSSKKSEIRESNKIKKSLFDFYRNIQGFGISSDSENRGFDLGVLSSKIYSLLFDKYIDNSEIRILSEFQFLDGALLVSVIEEYMQKANVSDSILDFQVIYDSSIENQNKKAQEISIREYKQQLLTKFSEETQPTEQDILDWHFQYFQPKKLLPTKLVGNLNQRLQCLKNITDNISEIHSKLSFKIKSQDLFLKMSDQKKKKEISNLIDTQIKSRAIGDEFSNEYSFLDFKSFQSFPELQTSLEKMAQRYFQNSQESRRLRNFTKFIDWFKRFEKKFSNLNGYDPKWDENIKKFGKEMEEKMKQKKKEENDFFQILETIDSVEFILFWLEEMCQNLKDFSGLRSNHLDAKQTNLKNANLGTTKEKIKSADNEFYKKKSKEKNKKKNKKKKKKMMKMMKMMKILLKKMKMKMKKKKKKKNKMKNEKEKEKENENEKEKQKQKQKQKEKQKQKQKQNENEKEKQNENPFDEDDEDDSPFNEDDENENEKEKQNEKQNENEKEKQKDENPFDEDDEDDSPFNEDEDEDEKEKEKQNEKQKENEKEKEKQKEKQNQNQKENDENLFDEDDEDDDDEDLFSDSKK
ncbi:chascon isoform d-related [Anaeramoeba ignava]|uniref:Chascon isoform d-related n=1 Tax=Anaeramoeba ignava TaxID=1746090 RepID=A0A9Q0LPU2_ANAIG|nr:chascon isoform d-related [Anaeramoeba ignava]